MAILAVVGFVGWLAFGEGGLLSSEPEAPPPEDGGLIIDFLEDIPILGGLIGGAADAAAEILDVLF